MYTEDAVVNERREAAGQGMQRSSAAPWIDTDRAERMHPNRRVSAASHPAKHEQLAGFCCSQPPDCCFKVTAWP